MEERKEKIIQNLVSQLQIPKEVWEEIKSRWREFDLPGDPYLPRELQVSMLISLCGVEKSEQAVEAFVETLKKAEIFKNEMTAKHGIKLPFSTDELLLTLLIYLVLKDYEEASLEKPLIVFTESEDKKEELKKVYKLNTILPEALVIFCSDPRFKKATEDFIEYELDINPSRCISIVVGGSISHLLLEDTHPENHKFLMGQLEFFKEHFPLFKKIILINHQDCKGYKKLYRLSDVDTRQRQNLDLLSAVEPLKKIMGSDIEIKTYYATINGEEVKFERPEKKEETKKKEAKEEPTEETIKVEVPQIVCSKCRKQIPQDSAKKCKEDDCKRIFCPECAEKHLDSGGYCIKHTEEDTEKCECCEKEYFAKKMKQCSICDNMYCPECLSKKPELLKKCSGCGEVFCQDCEGGSCDGPNCGKIFCENCNSDELTECDSCDNAYCHDCVEKELDDNGECSECV